MKRVWKQKEGVSPVIATILMVAITVVLAAVLYTMVIKPQTPTEFLVGSLTYIQDGSEPSNGRALFVLGLSTPVRARVADVSVILLNEYSQKVTNGTWCNWTHIVSDDTSIAGGDRLTVSAPGIDLSGYEVTVSISGFTGAFGARIPD
ncbi:MAG: archaellin/type IV pilin N-terminal domain-containing protein [Candidatus Thermoplasmatota archaeon]